jgi:hypothetical protein
VARVQPKAKCEDLRALSKFTLRELRQECDRSYAAIIPGDRDAWRAFKHWDDVLHEMARRRRARQAPTKPAAPAEIFQIHEEGNGN